MHEFIARLVRVSIDNRSNRRDDKSISIMCRGFLRDNALCDHDRHDAAFSEKAQWRQLESDFNKSFPGAPVVIDAPTSERADEAAADRARPK